MSDFFMAPFYTAWMLLKNSRVYLIFPRLMGVDLCLYIFRLMYFTPRMFVRDPEEDTYGECVYRSLAKLSQKYLEEVTSFVDLGSGLGKVVFYMSLQHGCRSVGIEKNPTFVAVSRWVSRLFRFRLASFTCGNFLSEPWPVADVYFCNGTCYSTATLHVLSKRLVVTAPGAVVFSTSHPLPGEGFELLGMEFLPFSWGRAHVYIQRVQGPVVA